MPLITLILFCFQVLILSLCFSVNSFWDMNPQEVRRLINKNIMETDGEKCEVFSVSDKVIQKKIPLRIYIPNNKKEYPAILFIHGGGWVAGNLDTHDFLARHLCHHAQAAVVSVGYSNSPEKKFPVPLEECYEALLWIQKSAKKQHFDLSRLAVVGDSAGGNMAASLCLFSRDHNGPKISLQVLINPSPDLRGKGTLLPRGDSDDNLRWFAAQYVANSQDAENPYVSPIVSKDFKHLPPAVIILAEQDEQLEDGKKYAQRLQEANIKTQVYIQKGIGHLAAKGARASAAAHPSLKVAVEALRSFDLAPIPGKIIDYETETLIPVVSFESIELQKYTVLKQFNIELHIPEIDRKRNPEYFRNRKRTVYLTDDQKFAVKVWDELHPAAKNFMQAVSSHFYDDIAQIAGIFVDKKSRCRGYITNYIISREKERNKWESYGFILEKNVNNINIFSNYDKQPQNYREFYDKLISNTIRSGYFSTDFCPNNIGIEPKSKKLYLFDLEDVLPLDALENRDSEMQMLLEYNPQDYLNKLSLLRTL